MDRLKKYLNSHGIDFYLKDIEILDQELINELREYENIMDYKNEIVFLEMNKIIIPCENEPALPAGDIIPPDLTEVADITGDNVKPEREEQTAPVLPCGIL